MRILITGSRDWGDSDAIRAAIYREGGDSLLDPSQVTVVHGTARGADTIAGEVAWVFGCQVEEHPADWSQGRGAGIARNLHMVSLGADVCLAFIKNGSRGATHCANAAERAGIRTERFLG